MVDAQTEQSPNLDYLSLIQAIATEPLPLGVYTFKLKNSRVAAHILDWSRQEQVNVVMAMVAWCAESAPSPEDSLRTGFHRYWNVFQAISQLLNRQLPLTHEQLVTLLAATNQGNNQWLWLQSMANITKTVEYYLKEHPCTPALAEQIEQIIHWLPDYGSAYRKYHVRLEQLIAPNTGLALPLVRGEAFSDRAIQDLEALPPARQQTWTQLLIKCQESSSGKPSGTWLKSTQPLLDAIGLATFHQYLLQWFPLVERPRTQPIASWSQWQPDPNQMINERNADILKGLVWLCATTADEAIAKALARLAVTAYRKVPTIGPRCVRLGNACVWALGQIDNEIGVAQLAWLKVKVKFGTAQKGIEKALTVAAEPLGLTRFEVEELSIPAYGLETVGLRRERLDEFTAELVVTNSHSTELRWFKPDGKLQKSIPKAVKDNHADTLKELKQAAKDIQTMLPVQRDRLEQLYWQQKTWPLAVWQERYLNHPLVGTLARRLIWQFHEGEQLAAGIWHEGQFVSHDGRPLGWIADTTQVQLWHPIFTAAETILAWRNWLLEHQIQQPFKQAYRELYLLTAAEENTRVYSNRFAAHILKQHQFNALCGQRGWKNRLRLMVDDELPPPTLSLPQWGLRAEFWVEGIGDNYGTDTTETGTFLYLATDQVRFYPLGAAENYAHAGGGRYSNIGRHTLRPGEPIPLKQIPALVFSEVMRDVDLFVGVASVGNDPNWSDGGVEGRYRDYWYGYSFGELSETAKTRKQVLETLIPRLKIRARCQLRDKFLVVRGDLRTYKIHLGSGNILMEPNDRYLCIVPARGGSSGASASQVFLPFEGDNMLSIILSKAFLLADDTSIKDPTIVHQIR